MSKSKPPTQPTNSGWDANDASWSTTTFKALASNAVGSGITWGSGGSGGSGAITTGATWTSNITFTIDELLVTPELAALRHLAETLKDLYRSGALDGLLQVKDAVGLLDATLEGDLQHERETVVQLRRLLERMERSVDAE